MPRWSLDELRATLTRLQDPSRPSPLADRLGIDALRLRDGDMTLRLRSRNPEDRTVSKRVQLNLESRTGTVAGGVLVELEYGISEATGAALDALVSFGVAQHRCAIYWNFEVKRERRGEGLGLLLAAAGAAWAADRGYAITGGAGLSAFITTSEEARLTYRRLATLLPHVFLPRDPLRQTLVPTTFVVGEHPGGLQLPQEQRLHEVDLSRIQTLLAWVRSTPAKVVVSGARAKILSMGGDERLLHIIEKTNRELSSEDDRARSLDEHLDALLLNSAKHIGTTTTYLSPLPVIYGGPLKGILTGNLGLNP